ncbi:MAG: LysM peptidoglycan-binding domain-containing protein [Chloroflexi bacterium]|nr:LysM peptidoglycan-binding domain-containing protein [Chloroflexota bacterium]
MMKKSRLSLPLGMLALLLIASLLTGCFREVAPDVTDVPADAQSGDPPVEEGTPDIMATGIAQSTLDAGTTGEEPSADGETQPTQVPTVPPPAPTDTPVPPEATDAPSTTAVPTFTPSPAQPTATPSPTGEVKHTVQPGENLFRIALRYGTTVDAVSAANGIANPAMIYVGQVLTISSSATTQPPSTEGETTYVVQPGDNLFRIALRYNLSYTALAQHNSIANPASIYVGQVIYIP